MTHKECAMFLKILIANATAPCDDTTQMRIVHVKKFLRDIESGALEVVEKTEESQAG